MNDVTSTTAGKTTEGKTTDGVELHFRVDAHHQKILGRLPTELLDFSDLARTRAEFELLPQPEMDPSVTTEDVMVPGLDGDPDLMVRLYRPPNLSGNPPALYWIHGGGMVIGSVAMDDATCARHAIDQVALVASVEYRLAPEHPFPAPMHDCYAGLSWFADNAADIGFDPSRLAIGGASAGGGLAAGLALMARDRGGPGICFQLLVFPMLDHRNETHSSHAIHDPRVWHRAANLFGWKAYLGEAVGSGDVSPYASPSVAADLSGLPPAYVNIGDLDMFLDEDVAYALALGRAGVACELHVYPGAFHGSNDFVKASPLTSRWKDDERQALYRALHL